jgi:hypothetical protein
LSYAQQRNTVVLQLKRSRARTGRSYRAAMMRFSGFFIFRPRQDRIKNQHIGGFCVNNFLPLCILKNNYVSKNKKKKFPSERRQLFIQLHVPNIIDVRSQLN